MPYISTDRVKEIRNEIKKQFPDFKFSVRTRHHSTVVISIMEGPLDFETNHADVNHFYIKDHWKGEASEMLARIKEIANAGNYTEVEDGDYGFVPSFYLDINIGEWDKPYKVTNTATDKASAQ